MEENVRGWSGVGERVKQKWFKDDAQRLADTGLSFLVMYRKVQLI